MRHGYYLANKEIVCGDEEYAKQSEDLYKCFANISEEPLHFDGASRYEYKGLVKTVVMIGNRICHVFYQSEEGEVVQNPDERN